MKPHFYDERSVFPQKALQIALSRTPASLVFPITGSFPLVRQMELPRDMVIGTVSEAASQDPLARRNDVTLFSDRRLVRRARVADVTD